MIGHCKWFSALKGFGFVAGADGKDYFIHCSEISASASDLTLSSGDEVEFDAGQNAKGPLCKRLKVLGHGTSTSAGGSRWHKEAYRI